MGFVSSTHNPDRAVGFSFMKSGFKLRVEGLSKSFIVNGRRLPVLNEIRLEVRPSEFVGIIGPSGCGKTTLLSILAGLYAPDGGRIFFEDEPASDYERQRVTSFAYMQQKDLLLPWRSVLGNAIVGLELLGVPKKEARREAQELLRRFGLWGFERVFPSALSGGMRQRVALVRTLLTKREILLLDEPFGALDAMTRSALHNWLLQAWQEFKRTVLFVTHDVEEVLLLSDRVYVLTARPARVKDVITVDLPRPRHVLQERFIGLKARLLELVSEEKEVAFAGAS